MNGVIIGLQCRQCSQWFSVRELIGTAKSGYLCWKCWDKHKEALRCLSGDPPKGCQNCGLSFSLLAERTKNSNVRMFMHWKDGILQVLCPECSDKYSRKRLDLYGNTLFGWLRKLKGAK